MALYLGSFANGLFQGAQSAASLYTQFQAISSQQDMQAQLDVIHAQNKANANVPGGWNQYTQQPYGTYEPSGKQGVPEGPNETLAPPAGAEKPASEQQPPPGKVSDQPGQKGPTATPARAVTGVPSPNDVSGTTPASGGSINPGASSDPYRNNPATGLPAPAMSGTPFNAAGVPGQAGSPSGSPQYSPTAPSGPPGTSFGLPGEPQPYAPPTPWIVQEGQRLIARGQEMVRGVAAGAHATNPATMPPSQMYGGTGFGPPALPPAYTAPTTEPIPSSQPGRPVIPPEQRPPPAAPVQAPISASPYNPAGAPGGAGTQSGAAPERPLPQGGPTVLPPGGGNEPVTGGIPQASAQPPSLGRSIWNAIIPQAEAATHPTAGQSAAADAAAPTPAAPAAALPPAQKETLPAVPAKPPEKAPVAQPAAPVPVKGAPVTPEQKGPTVASEAPQQPLAPPISPAAWDEVSRTNPELAQLIEQTALQVDPTTTIVSKYALAQVIKRESGFRLDVPDGAAGEVGMGQVKPATWAMVSSHYPPSIQAQLTDGHKPEVGIFQAAALLKYLAVDKGLVGNSIQTHYAYMSGDGDGPKGAAYIAKNGVDSMDADRMKYLRTMWPDTPIVNAMFTGGINHPSGAWDVPKLVAIGNSQGPEPLLNELARNGPAGMPMSERWSNFQAAAERYAIWSGHPEMIPQTIEWVAQMSQQGAVSNMIAADQAMRAGDMAGAAKLLARGHAFFPDGSYSRFGTTKSGLLVGEQFGEASGMPLGKPTVITHDMLMEQIIAMQHPLTYVGAQQTYQKNNAEIQQLRAHAKFYAENPEMRQAIANAQIEGRQNVANTQVAGKLEVQGLTLEHKRELDAAKSEQINAIDTTLNKQLEEDQIGPLNADKKPIFTPEQYGSVVETQRALMYPQHAGGANMNKLAAKNASEQLGQRNWTIKEQLDSKGNRMVDASGNPLHYGMYDSEGHAHGYLSPAAVGRLMAIPGMGGVLQQQQAPAEGGAKPVHGALNMQPSPVGAGAGTYGAMSQGIGQNLAGIAPTPMQQRQSYPQSMVA